MIHHDLSISGYPPWGPFDLAHTGFQPGVQLRRSPSLRQREIIIFVKGDAPALAAEQTGRYRKIPPRHQGT